MCPNVLLRILGIAEIEQRFGHNPGLQHRAVSTQLKSVKSNFYSSSNKLDTVHVDSRETVGQFELAASLRISRIVHVARISEMRNQMRQPRIHLVNLSACNRAVSRHVTAN
jgi:hypothetical protein